MSSSESTLKIPSEFRLSLKWENAIKKFSINMAIGAVIAGASSIVLFRRGSFRLALTTFGAGFGAGDAFRQTTIEFDKEKAASS